MTWKLCEMYYNITPFQSPLIGASVMTNGGYRGRRKRPRVSIPSDRGFCNDPNGSREAVIAAFRFQSPLIGASVMTDTERYFMIGTNSFNPL